MRGRQIGDLTRHCGRKHALHLKRLFCAVRVVGVRGGITRDNVILASEPIA